MANLETLELTIRANAESASQGVNNLIGSLTRLNKAVGKSVGGLRLLVSELKKLEEYSGIKLPDFAKAMSTNRTVGNIKARAKAVKELTDAEKENMGNRNAVNKGSPSAKPQDVWEKEYAENMEKRSKMLQEMYQKATAFRLNEQIKNLPLIKFLNGTNQPSNFIQSYINQTMGIGAGFKSAAESASVFMKKLPEIEQEIDNLNKKDKLTIFERIDNAINQIGEHFRGLIGQISSGLRRVQRIASTMLIRTALRSLLKGFTNAWNALYEFSKNADGAFAQSIDRIKGLTLGAAQSLITAFSPALSALVPVVNAVAAAINYLANTIQWLFSLLGLGSDLFGATTEEINKFANASSGGSSAAKEMLASFDELNVISSKGGGGGGGGGGTSAISAVIGEELANIGFAINEALLAVGLILACFGHPVIGVGLMAIGAAGIVKTFTADWGGLSEEIKGEIEKIMAIVGVSFLAIGAALAFSGIAVPLGIGLMAIGAANMAGVLVAGFKDEISPEIKATITKITGIVGGALLALGAILLFFGGAYTAPMGIGLLLAGGLSLASAVALNWDYIVNKIIEIATSISDWLVGAWNTVSGAVSSAWEVVSQWWGNILSKISLAWGFVATWLDLNVWQPIKRFFTGVWDVIQEFWRDPLGCIIRAWQAVEDWVINNVWQPIKEFFVNTWNSIKEFWKEPLALIQAAWQNVARWFDEYVWTPIKGFFDYAWNAIKEFWADPLGVIKRAWDGIANWINKNVWEPIGSFVSGIWNSIKQWWDTNIKSNFETAWSTVSEAFEPLRDILNEIWTLMQSISGFGGINVTGSTSNAILNAALNNGNTSNNGDSSIFKTLTTNAKKLLGKASGGFGISQGEVFIAQEQGAELVGSINGKTSVANQEQIIEGIARGVESANADQNTLLREQNTLLRQILQKDNSVRLSASAQLGRVTRQSLDMYGSMVGG